LSEHIENKIVIISSDRDFKQLISKRVKLYDPIRKEKLVCEDVNRFLKIKILMGDKSDNIPSIKKGLGPKRSAKLIDEGKFEEFISDEQYKDLFKRNFILISFKAIPQKLKKIIVNVYQKNKNNNNFNLTHFFKYCEINKLQKILNDERAIRKDLKNLILLENNN